MGRRVKIIAPMFAVGLLLCLADSEPAEAQNVTVAGTAQGGAVAQSRLIANYGELPLRFEANQGQTDSRVQFVSRGSGYTLFLTSGEAVLTLAKPVAMHGSQDSALGSSTGGASQAVVRLQLAGANSQPVVTQEEELPTRSNYFIGSDPAKWRTNVPNFGRVRYHNVYPGVDLVYYGNQGQLEHDFVVAPGVDPSVVTFAVRGADKLELEPNGDLAVHTAGGDLRLLKPEIYQVVDGARRKVPGKYLLEGENKVGFQIASFDRRRQLVIDPVLLYSTYLGGSGRDGATAIAVDSNGNAYITGGASSANFPTTSGAFQTSPAGPDNLFVTKLNAAGTALVYSTYLGGDGISDGGKAIALDSSGDAYVTGETYSTNFPTTNGAFQKTSGGNGSTTSAFVTKLNPDGSALVYSSYLGGSGGDEGLGITVDSSGNAYIAGSTQSSNFPTTSGVLQTTLNGFENAFVTKLNPTGSALVYSTYLGEPGSGLFSGTGASSVAVDSNGNAYVTGSTGSPNFPTTPGVFQNALIGVDNAFVSKLNPTGTALLYSTYLGGGTDEGTGIALDSTGNAYIVGQTGNSNFPTTSGAFQATCSNGLNYTAFVTKMNATGTALLYSTCLGGTDTALTESSGKGIAVDSSGNAYVTGTTSTPNFPTTSGAFQTTYGGNGNAFVTELNATGAALVYSTYLGGSGGNAALGIGGDAGAGIAVDSNGNIYVTGYTGSPNFPTTPGAFQTAIGGSSYNAFISKFGAASGPATPTISAWPTASPITYGQTLASSTLSGGSASVAGSFAFTTPTTVPGAGTYSASVTFTPTNTADYTTVTGEVNVIVNQATPTVTAWPTATSITVGQSLASSTLSGGSASVGGSFAFTMPTTVPGAGSYSASVIFTPTDAVDYTTVTGSVTVTVNAAASPAASLTPGTLTFTGTVGSTTAAQTATLMNSGNAALSITGIAITGTGASGFAQTNTCGSSLAAGASCTVSVTFTPASAASFAASLSIADNASGSPQTVTLNGTGTALAAPGVSFSQATLTFSAVARATSAAQSTTLTNTGNATLSITGITITGTNASDFAETNTCGETLAAGASCTISATFTPASAATYTATVSVADNAASSPQTVTLNGTGNPAPSFTVSSSTPTQTAAPGGTATYTIAVTPQNGAFTNAVLLAASGLPTGAIATFTPSSVTPGSAAADSTLTIQTAATTATASNLNWPLAAPALAALGLFFLPGKKRRRWITLCLLLFASLGALTALSGCGGGFALPAPANVNYNITITGTSGSESQTTTVVLTVQ